MKSAPGGFSDQEHGNAFRVLDYGCGSGQIVEQLKKRNAEAPGVTSSMKAALTLSLCLSSSWGASFRPEVDGFPPGNVDALTAALDRLMADAALRVQFAAQAVEARERFSMERIARMWEELFAEVRL